MFWGLVLKANRKYTQSCEKSFHLSQAALDITSCTDEPVQVFLTSEGNKHLLCTLRKKIAEQVPLDLNFKVGDEVEFQSSGSGTVHLSGYLIEVDELDFMGGEESDIEEEEEDVSAKPNKKKQELSKKQQKALQAALAASPEDDDSDEEDSDFDGAADEEDGEEEEDEDDESGEEEEEESDSDEEIEEPKPKQAKIEKSKQNGLENGTKQKQEKAKKEKKDAQPEKPQKGGEKTLQGGVKIEDLRVGTGAEAKPGKKVGVYYEGRLKSNNKVFDSSKSGAGFKFSLGRGEVIKAWDVGVAGMKVGGKRRITCPPHMAYGAKGSPPVIPPNSTLVFEVELKSA